MMHSLGSYKLELQETATDLEYRYQLDRSIIPENRMIVL